MFLGHPSYQDPTIIHDRIDWLDVTSGLTSFSCLSLAVVDATGWADLQEIHGDAHTYTHSHSFTHGILRLHPPPPEGTYCVVHSTEQSRTNWRELVGCRGRESWTSQSPRPPPRNPHPPSCRFLIRVPSMAAGGRSSAPIRRAIRVVVSSSSSSSWLSGWNLGVAFSCANHLHV